MDFCQTLVFVLSVNVLSCYGQGKTGLNAAQIILKVKRLPASDVCGKNSISLGSKVINGKPADLGEYPWMANIGYRNKRSPNSVFWGCAGSLITDQHVITAAHCLKPDLIRGYSVEIVRLGELDLNESVDDGAFPKDFEVDGVIFHEQYDNAVKQDDIGIIKLKDKVTFTDYIRPICLPPPEFKTNMFVGYRPVVAGWGKSVANNTKATPDTRLLEAYVSIKDLEGCKRNVTSKLTTVVINERNICAAGENTDSCKGDSGGPLMFHRRLKGAPANTTGNMFLMGIVSYGHGCAEPGYPGVYTRVSHQMNWLIENLDI